MPSVFFFFIATPLIVSAFGLKVKQMLFEVFFFGMHLNQKSETLDRQKKSEKSWFTPKVHLNVKLKKKVFNRKSFLTIFFKKNHDLLAVRKSPSMGAFKIQMATHNKLCTIIFYTKHGAYSVF